MLILCPRQSDVLQMKMKIKSKLRLARTCYMIAVVQEAQRQLVQE